MGTLLRVDPPGGCFAAPHGDQPLGGTLKSGSVRRPRRRRRDYYQVNPKTTGARGPPTGTSRFSGVATGAATLSVTYKGRNSSSANQTIYLWDWTTSSWTQLSGPTTVGTSDVTVTRG